MRSFKRGAVRALAFAATLFVLLFIDIYVPFIPKGIGSWVHGIGAALVAAIAVRQCFRLAGLLRWDYPLRSAAWRLFGVAGTIACIRYVLVLATVDYLKVQGAETYLIWFEVAFALMGSAALGMLVFSWPITGRFRLLLDSVTATSSIAVLSWYFVIDGLWHGTKGDFFAKTLAVVEPGADTILVFMSLVALICASGVKRLSGSVGLLTIGGLLIGLGAMSDYIGDHFSIWLTLQVGALVVPLGWLLVVCAGAIGTNQRDQENEFGLELKVVRSFTSPLSAAGPYSVAVFAFALVAYREVQMSGSVSVAVYLLTCVLMSLVVARQFVTLAENQSLARRVSEFNRDLEQVVEKRTSQLQSLYSLAKSIGNSLDLPSVIEHSMEHAVKSLHSEAVVLNLTPFAFSAQTPMSKFIFERGADDLCWALDQLNVLDTPWHSGSGTLHDQSFTSHVKYVLAPLLFKGKSFGWIALLRQDQPYEQAEVDLTEGLGMEIATALENARLYEIARQMADIDSVSGLLNHRAAQERFEFAFNYAKEMGEPLSVLMIDVNNFKHFNDAYGHLAGDHVLKSIAKALRDTLRPHDIAARYGGDEFLVLLPNTDMEVAQELAKCLEDRVSKDGFREPGEDRVIPYALSIGLASYPEEASNRHDLISNADKNMYRAKRASRNASPTVVRTQKREQASPEGFDLLESMIIAVDNKDYYTRAHSEEVTEYSLWIAVELGLSEEAQRTIRLAALLHDVGKIGVPDEILRKPAHLTGEEFEVMRQHPEVGAFMVGNIPGLADIVPGVKYHHERWDGTGYPDRLRGDSIPLLGRIIAVPDAFSAMTTDRPYRKGMDWQLALQKLRDGAGSQFDPRIVDAFERAILKRRGAELLRAA